jgi:hypothetical protein
MENQPQPTPEVTNSLDNFFNLSFDTDARQQLKQIALWSKICSLSAFAGYVISLVVAIFGHKNYSLEAEGFSFGGYIRSGTSLVGVLITVAFGGIVNYFLYRFAVAVDQGIQSSDALKVNTGFDSLRIYFKILGIVLVIAFSLVIIGIVIGLIAGLVAVSRD